MTGVCLLRGHPSSAGQRAFVAAGGAATDGARARDCAAGAEAPAHVGGLRVGGGEVAGAPVPAALRVLFVSNSLTFQNDLPEIVSPVGLPPLIEGRESIRIDLDPERSTLLQEAAARANACHGRG